MTVYPSPPQKRRELDICNVIFCLLVILIHILAEPVTYYRHDSIHYALVLGPWRLSSYVVQGFLFLAGVKTFIHNKSPSDPFSYKKYAYGRLQRVVFPYLAAALLFSVYYLAIRQVPSSVGAWLLDVLTGRLVGHFYFVPVICQFYVLIPWWRRIVYHSSAVLSMLTSLLIMLLCKLYLPDVLTLLIGGTFSDNALLCTTYLFYFIAGCFCGKYYEHFRAYLRQNSLSVYIGFGICAVINWIFIVLNGREIYCAPWLEMFHVLYCIFAILASLALADHFSVKHSVSSFLCQSINRHSYTIYLLHPLAIFLCNNVCTVLGITSLSLRLMIRLVFTYIFSVFILGYLAERLRIRLCKNEIK